MNERLKGVYAAVLVPFDKEGKILYDSLQKHVDYLVRKGIDGFYVNGSTGESFLLTPEERMKVVECVVEANAGRAKVINHCGAIGTDLTIDLIEHCAKLPIDGVSSVPPFYYNFKADELVQFYNDLANASDKPFVVYNMPKFSGVVITPDLMARLRENPRIQGLKFTHNDFASLQAIKTSDPDLVVYNGFDEMAICGMAMGCDGAIGSTYNVNAPLILKLVELTEKNDFVGAKKVQDQINDFLFSAQKAGTLFVALKYMLTLIEGIEYGSCRRPFSPLSAQGRKICEDIVERFAF